MNISITPELEKFIADKVKSGMYQSASEVVREGLRLLAEQERRKQHDEYLKREIQKGLDSLERGERFSETEVRAHMKEIKEKFFQEHKQ